MHPMTSRLRGRCCGDSGSIVAESAIILPVVLAFLAGVIDMGVAFRDRIQIENALRAAARIGAAGQNTYSTDQLILTSLNASMVGIKNADVTRIVVYETGAGGQPASTCKTTAVPGTVTNRAGSSTSGSACNIYSKAQMAGAGNNNAWFTASTATSCSTTTIDSNWCPLDRVISLTATGSGGTGPDYLGIWMTVDYTPYTRFWGTKFTITDYVVVRLEPSAV